MNIDKAEIKLIKDMLEELAAHRKAEDDEPRATGDNGLYDDENRFAEKLGIQID